ncbi:MAG TPA: hypothetical protein RMG45_27490, partial [Polyangiaceae bacterium LLY-WYZ-15_(1-7)]|nr:hypothetical protein [Polyangiaceae bacterium LLY-WYZ-15_(1-7)]
MARDSLLRACATLGLLLAFSGCSALVDPDEGQLGGPNSDSGIVLMDAGGGGVDAGPRPDTGTPPVDAGPGPADTGTPPADTGTPPV